MAAGLGFKTFNTGDVLSAGDTNGYLMQGVLVFADAAARTAAITSPQEGQTSYLKDTDVIQVYSGSAWVTKSGAPSPLTTKGDVYTYSTTDARLAVGANDTVLTADSSTATGLKWAAAAGGSLTLISTTSLTGATVTLSSIPQTYKMIRLIIKDFYHTQGSGNDRTLNFTVNSTTGIYATAGSNATLSSVAATTSKGNVAATIDGVAADNIAIVDIYEYTSTATFKYADAKSFNLSPSTLYTCRNDRTAIRTSSAITSVSLEYDAFNHQAGTVELWGIN